MVPLSISPEGYRLLRRGVHLPAKPKELQSLFSAGSSRGDDTGIVEPRGDDIRLRDPAPFNLPFKGSRNSLPFADLFSWWRQRRP
jgi:hypothetical protein